MSEKSKCKVNSDGSVCLSDILVSFNSGISQEHAWALCYQCAKFFSECLQSSRESCYVIDEVEHVYLKTDGALHEKTVAKDNGSLRKELRCDRDVVGNLGAVIYKALDQGVDNNEERTISDELEQLIGDMVSRYMDKTLDQTHQETDDEGIERDSEENEEPSTSKPSATMTLQDVITRCEAHLATLTKSQCEAHYKAVVRALVLEAIELSTFLEKVEEGGLLTTSSSNNSNLDQLNFSDWAQFWMQVMNELRTGVKLKKVNYTKAPIEYELTPYEILMKDIRSCRYNLRKIMINGDVPSRVTKDAHAIILDFIRSRPPLKKVSDRKLPPRNRVLTPREQLLNSIRKGRKLRPVPAQRTKREELRQESPKQEKQMTSMKLIEVDYSKFEVDDDDEDEPSSPNTSEPGLWGSEYLTVDDGTLEAYDLAAEYNPLPNARKNTLSVVDSKVGCYSVPQSRPGSRQSYNSSEAEPIEPEIARVLQEGLANSQSWQDSIPLDDRLSLTLAEIVHIRAVLTKAELEALPAEGRVRHDVETRRVCFLCLKTRFGIFGPWGQRCSLCKRTVCSRCYSKMNIPMEHFFSVPVVLLSPSIMATPEDDKDSTFPRGPRRCSTSRESSPDCSRPNSSMNSSTISDPGSVALSKFRTKAATLGRTAKMVDRFKPSQMIVCHDCKLMVLQIIKSARANRSAIRNKTLQSLTLNLSPVF